MNKNAKIAKELVKLAKLLVSNSEQNTEQYRLPLLPIELKKLNENEIEDISNYLCENNKYIVIAIKDKYDKRGTLYFCGNTKEEMESFSSWGENSSLPFDKFQLFETYKCSKTNDGKNDFELIDSIADENYNNSIASSNAYWDLAGIQENSSILK